RILFFCGGETFLWKDGDRTLRDLVIEAKEMGFLIVNVVTNGTFPIDLPEADLILLSLDGDRERHNAVRGDTFDAIMENISRATADNICFYMAINQINKDAVADVCRLARDTKNVRAVSFNFHTPYPDTRELALSKEEKAGCCRVIENMMKEGAPVFNLKSAFPYLIDNSIPTPCHQCVVIEDGKVSVCGRCIDVPGLCSECGYFFVAEYTLLFRGNLKVIFEMLRTYLRYV
ncbi:MAG: metallo cofactor biosynthesis protein, partial [Firmicutes bacterium]|nr:metallo cofactor biosynthesis protein [Bacillota bacterium]